MVAAGIAILLTVLVHLAAFFSRRLVREGKAPAGISPSQQKLLAIEAGILALAVGMLLVNADRHTALPLREVLTGSSWFYIFAWATGICILLPDAVRPFPEQSDVPVGRIPFFPTVLTAAGAIFMGCFS